MDMRDMCESLKPKLSNSRRDVSDMDENIYDLFGDDEKFENDIGLDNSFTEGLPHKVLSKPEWNIPDDMMRRITEHKISDQRTTDILKKTIEDNSYLHRGMSKKTVDENNIKIATFIKGYLDKRKTDKELIDEDFYNLYLPPSFSPTSVFPMHFIATVGAAGTGKSESVKAWQSECMDMFTTSHTNSASEEFTKGVTMANHPACREYEKGWKTLIKVLCIPFFHDDVREITRKICQNGDDEIGSKLFTMEREYIESCEYWTLEELEKENRKLMIENLKAMREMMMFSYDAVKEKFTHGHYKFRLGGLHKDNPFYQPPAATFEWTTWFDDIENKYANLSVNQHITNEERKMCQGLVKVPDMRAECQMMKAAKAKVMNQDMYKRYCAGQSQHNLQPHILSQQDITMVEEDGKTPVFYLHYQSVFLAIINMIYNPPQHHLRPGTRFSSGSDAQIGAVNAVSALSHVISSKYNHCVRGDFFRRNLTSITSAVSEVTRVLPIVLENNMEITDATLETLAFNEKLSAYIKDPGHWSNGKRFYCVHRDNNNYITRMEATNKATIPVQDILCVSNNIVEVSGNKIATHNDPCDNNPHGVNLKNISLLNYEQSRRNRGMMWRKKIYQEYSMAIGVEKKFQPFLQIADRGIEKESYKLGLPENNKLLTTYSPKKDIEMREKKGVLIFKKKELKRLENEKNQIEESEDKIENVEENFKIMSTEDDQELDCESFQPKTIYIERKLREEVNEDDWGGKAAKNDEECIKNLKPRRTKVFITLPAKYALTTREHMSCRTQAENIAEFMGDGARYADKCHTNARKADQLGPFKYDPDSDMVVIYSSIDFIGCLLTAQDKVEKKGCKYSIDKLVKSAMENEQSCQMFMTFTRQRMFAADKDICHLGTKTTVTPRGVNGTLNQIMKDHSFHNSGVSASFKFAVYVGATHEFLLHRSIGIVREEATNLECELIIISKLKDIISDDTPMTKVINDYMTVLALTEEYHLKKTDEWKKKDINKKTAPDTCENTTKNEKQKPGVNLNAETFLCKILNKMRGIITNVIDLDPERAENNILSFNVEDTLVYNYIKSLGVVTSVPLDIYGDVKLTFLGNQNHPILHSVINESKANILSLDLKTNYKHFAGERKLHRYGINKSYSQICAWGLEQWFPERWYSSSLVLKIGSVLVANTNPTPPLGNITWQDLFSQTKSKKRKWGAKPPLNTKKYGLMTKLNMPMLQDGDKYIFNQSFTTHKGEFMNFPLKWEPGKGQEGSDVIVKMSDGRICNEVYYYDPVRASQQEKFAWIDCKNAVFDASHVHAFPVPFIMDVAMTSHAAQGKTIGGKVFIDFDSMVNPNTKKLIFDEETTKSSVLVCTTRADNPANLQSANSNNMKAWFPSAGKSKKRKREIPLTEHYR